MKPLVVLLIGALVAQAIPVSAAQATPMPKAGDEVIVAGDGAGGSKRIFVASDGEDAWVLNLSATQLPSSVERALREAAKRSSGLLVGNEAGTLVYGDVEINRSGVFVKGQNVAALSDLLEKVPCGAISSAPQGHSVPWVFIAIVGAVAVYLLALRTRPS